MWKNYIFVTKVLEFGVLEFAVWSKRCQQTIYTMPKITLSLWGGSSRLAPLIYNTKRTCATVKLCYYVTVLFLWEQNRAWNRTLKGLPSMPRPPWGAGLLTTSISVFGYSLTCRIPVTGEKTSGSLDAKVNGKPHWLLGLLEVLSLESTTPVPVTLIDLHACFSVAWTSVLCFAFKDHASSNSIELYFRI